ncbi:MAG: HutD family protein [Blautia sp.]|nr:HutD family protein [Blautia sp.]
MKILKEDDYRATRWDGGITREIYLYPETGSYQKREFQVRISSAVIEKEESDFTYLPGVSRYLMMQKGTAVLSMPNSEKLLKPGEVFSFEGDVPIHCSGKGTDLNLMLKDGAEGEMRFCILEPGEVLLLCSETKHFMAAYLIGGEAIALPGSETVRAGETVLADVNEKLEITCRGTSPVRMAVITWSVK